MAKKSSQDGDSSPARAGGILGSLATLLEKLGDLAETGQEMRRSGEFETTAGSKPVRGVYGFTIKTGTGNDGIKVEPFGNVHKDNQSGKTVVDEVHEPMVGLFEEQDHLLVVVEMPGIGAEDLKLELEDDILTINAAHGSKKYHKEILLPATFSTENMTHSCRNGVLEITFKH